MIYDPDHYVLCPMGDCGEPLHLTWSMSIGLDPAHLDIDAAVEPDSAHTSTWQVECASGHVLLLPGYTGCPCTDEDGSGCPHDQDDFDWSEDTRTFQGHDMGRLRDVLARLAPASPAEGN